MFFQIFLIFINFISVSVLDILVFQVLLNKIKEILPWQQSEIKCLGILFQLTFILSNESVFYGFSLL